MCSDACAPCFEGWEVRFDPREVRSGPRVVDLTRGIGRAVKAVGSLRPRRLPRLVCLSLRQRVPDRCNCQRFSWAVTFSGEGAPIAFRADIAFRRSKVS